MLLLVSEEATALFRTIASAYLAAGSPDRASHHFERGRMTDTLRELENDGLVQRVFGVVGGFAWRLTEAGVARAQQNS